MSELRSDLLKSPTPNVSFSHDPTSLSTTHTGEKPSLSSASSKLADAGASDDDADEEKQLLRERQVQAAITDELVEMARALKDTTLLAGSMVREDIETLDEVESIADRNQSKLAIEGQRLQKHMEVYASCWIWIALLNVSVVFIMMIIFIRLIPAPRF
ncbi:hypothetical protein SARC_15000 [Sphaeroforma arctica JP610]|uniref:t-SNARE coiled-coil homology domain-containing protein n=1 Tax=Sphaeroforma arctica JP610 TaxID=667725 RepID=A0A0L0F6T1_9EUKA|nr:hypothetical protein SARC_15000 [Sphaeroforma arctica JP610]KNC72442.1 hypothetical protein SARC_15000 [Sphaeroforma arctica JP610]|eukprot:XP_014146344.1 hypothetical protein SARC_15000 [Sphaeroforma arctica JP610]